MAWRRVAVRIAVRGDALAEGADLLADRRGLDEDGERSARVLEPARRHRGDRRSEDGPLGFRGRAADPLGQEPAPLVGFLGGREGREGDLLDPLLRALGVRVEEAQRLDAVSVELDAHGELPIRREDVEETSPHGEIAGLGRAVDARQRGQEVQPLLGEPSTGTRAGHRGGHPAVDLGFGRVAEAQLDAGTERVLERCPDLTPAVGADDDVHAE